MNPFVYPEFWLSLAFIMVIGLVILSPVRYFIKRFFLNYRQHVIDQIQQADSAFDAAQNLFKEIQKKDQFNKNTKELNQKIKAIQQEFTQKTKTQIETKKQDFQVRFHLTEVQIKNHLRTQLLNQAEEEILKKSHLKNLDKEVYHLVQMLRENKDQLRTALK